MFGFLKKAVKGLGGIVKKALPYVALGPVGGLLYKKAPAIVKGVVKGAEWIKKQVDKYKAKGMTQAEAEAAAVEDAKAAGGFPWLWVIIGAAALLVVILIIVLLTSAKRH